MDVRAKQHFVLSLKRRLRFWLILGRFYVLIHELLPNNGLICLENEHLTTCVLCGLVNVRKWLVKVAALFFVVLGQLFEGVKKLKEFFLDI